MAPFRNQPRHRPAPAGAGSGDDAQLLEALFDLSPDSATLSRISDGSLVKVNRAWCALAGIPAAEALGRTTVELGTWAVGDRAALMAELDRDGGIAPRESTVRNRDGGERRVLISAMKIRHGGEDLALITGKDITEQQQAKADLAESEERFRTVAEYSPVALILHRDTILYVNPAGVALVGATAPGQILGRAVLEFLAPEDLEEARGRMLQVLEGGAPVSALEARIACADGRSRQVSLRSRVVSYQGRASVLTFAQDVTEARKAQEAALQAGKAESLVLMAGSIAHDFNNLFAALQASLEIAGMQSRNNPEVAETLATAGGILQRAVNLSWKMNDFSGRAIIRMEPVDLAELVVGWAAGAGLGVELELRPVPRVRADAARLRLVLDALLGNAREAMAAAGLPDGRVRISLVLAGPAFHSTTADPGRWAAECPPGPETVCLSFANDGPFPGPEVLARMFDPFYTTRFVGRGLGLASVYGILQAHRAGIQVLPEGKRGFDFRIHFPVPDPEAG